jgi:hypothetical protein
MSKNKRTRNESRYTKHFYPQCCLNSQTQDCLSSTFQIGRTTPHKPLITKDQEYDAHDAYPGKEVGSARPIFLPIEEQNKEKRDDSVRWSGGRMSTGWGIIQRTPDRPC